MKDLIQAQEAPNYREVVGKSQVHKWMDTHYGKPRICEGKDCRGNATWYDWALKKDCEYKRDKNNFLRLCRSCHRRYDMTPEKAKFASNLNKIKVSRGVYYGTIYEYQGQKLTIADITKMTGISMPTFYARIKKYGWSFDKAMSQPVGKRSPNKKLKSI
jgi:hypothetical protein